MPKITNAGPSDSWAGTGIGQPEQGDEPEQEQDAAVEGQAAEVVPETLQASAVLTAEATVTAEQDEPDQPADPAHADVRAWAREQGIEVADAGPVPAAIVEQYLAAQTPSDPWHG